MELIVEQKIESGDKRREYNTSDVLNADIPEEIHIEILSRLPPESLSRCKCVSKHWNDTLTIQAFLVKHSRSYDKHSKLAFVARSITWGNESVLSFELNDDNTPKTTIMTVNGSCIRLQDVHLSYFLTRDHFYMSNICNDLICLYIPSSTCVCLLNINTQDFIRLPAITMKSDMSAFRSWYALGFDPVLKIFKVLSIIHGSTSKNCTRTMAAILTVGSKYWKPIEDESLPGAVIKKSPWWTSTSTLCHDGVIYWIHENTLNNVIRLTVVAFDLNREASREYELVRTPVRNRIFDYYLTSLKECPTMFIWKTKSDVEQWTLFNHKNPNAAWKMRNLTNHNFPIMVPYPYHGITSAGGSILLLQCHGSTNSGCSSYSSCDLENFALK